MRILILFIFFTMVMACKESQPVETEAEVAAEVETETVSASSDTISRATFAEWKNNWDSLGRRFTDTLLIKYYDMPVIDLEQTLGENPAGARFYHGLKSLGNRKYEAHLVLTATNQRGEDVGSYFDVTKPCPPSCGQSK